MIQQLPVIIVIIPLIFSLIISFIGQQHKNAGFIISLTALIVCLACSVKIFSSVKASGLIQYQLGGWPPPVGIEYRLDHLNGFMLVLISFIGMITAIHAKRSVEKELPKRVSLFWCLYLLLLTGLLGITITGDLFNLFVFLEVASLSGYGLVAVGNKKATFAGFRYLVLGTIGASFYLLGVGYLYIATGSLNMIDLSNLLPELYSTKTVILGFSFIIIGLGIKTAIFPMHIWLPDAYTYAPSAVSAVLAPLMTKVMAYVMIRIIFTVFQPEFSISVFQVTDTMVWIGTFAIFFGGLMALSQSDFKRMLSYVIIADIGYIIGGIGVANDVALKGAIFHIINDAIMMTSLFLTAGQVVYRKGGHNIDHFKNIFKSMPITATVFMVGALSVIGVPPTCGFFSKWYLLLGGIQAGQWGFVTSLAVCTLINISLFVKFFDRALFAQNHITSPDITLPGNSVSSEAPLMMLFPAVLIAIVIFLIGFFNQFIINDVLCFTIF